MRRLVPFLSVVVFCAGLFCLAQAPTRAAGWLPLFVEPHAGLSIDGTGSMNCATSASPTVTISTTLSNDVIILMVALNAGAYSSITDTAGLNWTSPVRKATTNNMAEYHALAPSALTSDVITFNSTGSTFTNLAVMAINGANTGSPFDPNAALPSVAASGDVSVTTTNANTVVYAGYRFSLTSTPTAGAGFTGIVKASCYGILEYKIVSAAQTALDMSVTTGAGGQNGGIGDAVTQ